MDEPPCAVLPIIYLHSLSKTGDQGSAGSAEKAFFFMKLYPFLKAHHIQSVPDFVFYLVLHPLRQSYNYGRIHLVNYIFYQTMRKLSMGKVVFLTTCPFSPIDVPPSYPFHFVNRKPEGINQKNPTINKKEEK